MFCFGEVAETTTSPAKRRDLPLYRHRVDECFPSSRPAELGPYRLGRGQVQDHLYRAKVFTYRLPIEFLSGLGLEGPVQNFHLKRRYGVGQVASFSQLDFVGAFVKIGGILPPV
jgi:hypothetical protein